MTKSPLVIPEIENQKNIVDGVDLNQVEKNINKIPNDYIEIKLASNGKLDAFKTLHFRDYSMDDALELNVLEEEDRLKALIKVLNNMIYEKEFDCKNFHIKELIQTLYTIHIAFISNKMEKEYYIDENLIEGYEEGQLYHEKNIDKIDIQLNKLNILNIDETINGEKKEQKFKEPFTVFDKIKKQKVTFRLSRVGDLLFAQEFCNEKYNTELFKYKPLKKALKKLEDIKDRKEKEETLNKLIENNSEEYENYMKFIIQYDSDYIRIVQALTIIAINDKKLETVADQLEAYRTNVSTTLWQYYNEKCEEYDFGIMDKYTFYSEVLKKNVTRRFQFQLLDFLPDTNKNYSDRFTVSFN